MKKLCIIILLLISQLLTIHAGADGINLPVLSEEYPGQIVRLTRVEKGDDVRYQSQTGPGKNYAGGGGFQSRKAQSTTAFFREGIWVYVHLTYATAPERYVYFQRANFVSYRNVPEVSELPFIEGTTTARINPKWGPEDKFAEEEKFAVSAGTSVKAFFQENNYVMAEFSCAEGLVRMWLPIDKVSFSGASGIANAPAIPSPKPKKDASNSSSDKKWSAWSDWSDNPVTASADCEVETRTLYRRKNEIEDWSEWQNGDPPYEGSQIETREFYNADGGFVRQWREYGYHYNYGEWSAWSENYYDNVVSSTDIVDSKTQYRYRTR